MSPRTDVNAKNEKSKVAKAPTLKKKTPTKSVSPQKKTAIKVTASAKKKAPTNVAVSPQKKTATKNTPSPRKRTPTKVAASPQKKTTTTVTPRKRAAKTPVKLKTTVKKTTTSPKKKTSPKAIAKMQKKRANMIDKDESSNKQSNKASITEKKKFTLVILKNGDHCTFETKTKLDLFLQEYKSNVGSTESFTTKKSMEEYAKELKLKETPNKTEMKPNVVSLIGTEQDKADSQRIIDRMRLLAPKERIYLQYYTNSTSHCVVVTIKEVDLNGKMKWWAKGRKLTEIITPFVQEKSIKNNPTLNKALANMEWAAKRDPRGITTDVETEYGKKPVKDENGKVIWEEDINKAYEVKVAFTHIALKKRDLPTKNKKQNGLNKLYTIWAKNSFIFGCIQFFSSYCIEAQQINNGKL